MKITNINSNRDLAKYLIGAKYIGIGRTAICFKTHNNRVLKLYYNSYLKQKLFERNDIVLHFINLNKISNDTYIGPDEILLKNGECIGYLYPYINAFTLQHAKYFYSISDILDRYDKLYEDTYDISCKRFELGDLHDRNILLESLFYVIDLDQGLNCQNEDKSINQIFSSNIKNINKTIIYSLFCVGIEEIIEFSDNDIQELYSSIYKNPKLFLKLLEKLEEKCNSSKTTSLVLKNKISYNKKLNTYYKFF